MEIVSLLLLFVFITSHTKAAGFFIAEMVASLIIWVLICLVVSQVDMHLLPVNKEVIIDSRIDTIQGTYYRLNDTLFISKDSIEFR